MSVWILDEGILDHFSWQNTSSSVRLDGFQAWTARFKSSHSFSMIFKSGDWDGHSRTLYLYNFERCFGSLSCWNIQPLRYFDFMTDSWTLFSRICWYWVESMWPSTLTRFPVQAPATQPHSMMEPLPNFTVGSKFFSWNAVYICINNTLRLAKYFHLLNVRNLINSRILNATPLHLLFDSLNFDRTSWHQGSHNASSLLRTL